MTKASSRRKNSTQSVELQAFLKEVEKADSILKKIEGLKSQLKRLRENLPSKVVEILRQTPLQDIQRVVTDLYWSSEHIGGVIPRASKLVLSRQVQPDPKVFPVDCTDCGGERTASFKSWTEYKYQKSRGRHRVTLCEYCRRERKRAEDERISKHRESRKHIEENLRSLRTMPYAQYLQTEHWKELRSLALKKAFYRCQLCNAQGLMDVHHRTYERRGEEYIRDVIVLCRPCHEKHHNIQPAN
jgi:hypothetical protein